MEFIIIAGVMTALMATSYTLAARMRRGHRRQVRDWATAQGWRYSEDGGQLLPFAKDVLGAVLTPKVEAVVTGQLSGRPFTLFQYHYSRPTKHDSQVYLVAVAVPLRRPYPQVRLTPMDIDSRVVVALGGQDLKVGHAGVDRGFRIRAQDVASARAALPPALADWLATQAPRPGLTVVGQNLVLWRRGWLRVEGAQPLVQAGVWAAAQLP